MIGAVLAGGAGARVGGGKPGLLLGGRPLVSYAIAALERTAGIEEVICVAKRSTSLPGLGVRVVYDTSDVLHPFAGVLAALDAGAPALVVGADMPFVTPELLGALASAPPCDVALAAASGRTHPLCARYAPSARAAIAAALAAEAPVRATLATVDVIEIPAADRDVLNVNTLSDLREAEAKLRTL